MKKGLFVFILGALFLMFASVGFSAEKTVSEWGFSDGMGQGDFAKTLVKATHAEGLLPAAATMNDIFRFWEGLGIVPPGGWNADKEITKDDVAAMLGIKSEDAKDLSFDDLVEKLIANIMDLLSGRSNVTSGSSISPIAPRF